MREPGEDRSLVRGVPAIDVERLVGFDGLTVWHRRNGKLVLYLILAHVVLPGALPREGQAAVGVGACEVRAFHHDNLASGLEVLREMGDHRRDVEAAELLLVLEGLDLSRAIRRPRWKPTPKRSRDEEKTPDPGI